MVFTTDYDNLGRYFGNHILEIELQSKKLELKAQLVLSKELAAIRKKSLSDYNELIEDKEYYGEIYGSMDDYANCMDGQISEGDIMSILDDGEIVSQKFLEEIYSRYAPIVCSKELEVIKEIFFRYEIKSKALMNALFISAI